MASGFFYRRTYGAYPGPREAFEKTQRQADAAECVRVAKDGRLVYEWKVDLRKLGGSRRKPEAPCVIGFDLVYFDRDGDDKVAFHLWGPSTKNRTNDSHQLADVLIADREPRFGDVGGRLAWMEDDEHFGQMLPQVSLESTDRPLLRVQTSCDAAGHFQVSLPEGRYAVSPVDIAELRVENVTPVIVSVIASRTTSAGLMKVSKREPPHVAAKTGVLWQSGPIDVERLESVIQAQMKHYRIPGASIAIIKDARVVYARALGVRDATTAEPVTDETLFEACSLTKPLFAFAVNRLAERGAIDLDKPLPDYLPRSARVADVQSDERLNLMTARHVLAHRSGFPNWRTERLVIQFTPGSRLQYSGEGFEYLGEVVAQTTDKSLDAVLREEALSPLNMTAASMICDDAIAAKSAIGHDGVRPLEKWMPKSAIASASLHVTARDYAKFLVALLRRSTISEEQWAQMLRPQFLDNDLAAERQFCLGIGVEETPYGRKYSHSGLNPGFTCYFAVFDERKSGYVFLLNNQKAGGFGKALETYLITGASRDKK
jgi:CubicO group peptidase (beta-lactamase class C family)